MRNQGNGGELQWFAIRVPPQKEQVAATILQRLNYIAVTPTEARLRRKTRYDKERREVQYSILPGFVFVAVTDETHVWRLKTFHFVNSIVTLGGTYARFDNQKLEAFLRYNPDTSPAYYKYMRTRQEFDIGDKVRILTGAFRDSEMKVSDISGREAIFLVPLLGRTHEVRVCVDDCSKAA